MRMDQELLIYAMRIVRPATHCRKLDRRIVFAERIGRRFILLPALRRLLHCSPAVAITAACCHDE